MKDNKTRRFIYRLKKGDEILKARLRSEARQGISWRGPVVAIDQLLLNDKPSKLYRTATGTAIISPSRYKKILEWWQKNRIGGRKEFDPGCVVCTWAPPKNAKLYFLVSDEFAVYYLLIKNGKIKFLAKTDKNKNALQIINASDLHLRSAISYIMREWELDKPKAA